MLGGIAEQISFFGSQIENLRFSDESLRLLESILVSRDVTTLIKIRSSLKEFMRAESVSHLKLMEGKPIDQILAVVEFFVSAFALVGDVESCLALKYEALTLRELKYMNHPWLQVLYEEWLNFAENSLDNGFYSIAVKGYENALLCIQPMDNEDPKHLSCLPDTLEEKIKELKDKARTLIASHSVQAQTAEYLKKKSLWKNNKESSFSLRPRPLASSIFRSGIKKRNLQKLHESQSLLKETNIS